MPLSSLRIILCSGLGAGGEEGAGGKRVPGLVKLVSQHLHKLSYFVDLLPIS